MSMLMFAPLSDEGKTRMERLWTAYHTKLLKKVSMSVDNVETAQELVCEAYTKLMENYDKYAGVDDEKLNAVLIIIVRNLVRNHVKKGNKVKFMSSTYINKDGESKEYEYEDSDADIEKIIFTQEQLRQVERAVGKINDIYREVLQLRLFVGQSYEQIAETLHISQELARKRYERGLKQVAKVLEDDGCGQKEV